MSDRLDAELYDEPLPTLDIAAIRRIRIEPGEVLAVQTDRVWSMEEATLVKQAFARALPGVPVIVLQPGVTLAAIHPEETP